MTLNVKRSSAAAAEGVVLLDASDTRRRLTKQALVLVSAAFTVSGVVAALGGAARWTGLALVVAGLLILVVASRLVVRWEVHYVGHVIRFENSVVFGERLYFDGVRSSAGALGYRKVIEATIARGTSAGERVRAESVAGLVRFQCRITVARP